MMNEDSLPSLIGALCAAMTSDAISAGDRAALRRLRPQDPPGMAFWRTLARYGVEPATLGQERAWGEVLRALAHCAEQHAPGRSLGAALAEAGVTELRLTRLLRARDDAALDEVRAVSNYLRAKGQRVDLTTLAMRLLTTDPDKLETSGRRIARDYFRQLSHDSKD